MNRDHALTFLKQNQPLPEDAELAKKIHEFVEVRNYFLANPDPACVPLFLNCFGEGSGYGVYQTIEDVVGKHDGDLVVESLKEALLSIHPSVRYWCAQISDNYGSKDLIDGLINVYNSGNSDAKCVALTALSNYDDSRVIGLARKALKDERDDDLLEIAEDIISG